MKDQPFSLGDGSEADQIKSYFRRLKALDEEAQAIAQAKRDVLGEAKAAKLHGPTLTLMVRRSRHDPEEVMEGDRLLETYEAITGTGAHVTGTLSMKRNAEGFFEAKMLTGDAAAAGKLTKSEKRVRDSVLLAELEERARQGE